ncbi:LacI family DNA-binding transcriptional regulator [Promicromonospora sukumoe]|uniref:DNA-binding LacI/PurR family transcriptional regulator n=1 Tax=Promicromonospora sukumoe TaxID=88382 RepID=A0A7W3JAH5_9MICO|nr:LacI family DNA-binding transcriptional regulator [Promicromonospora sukumoe]MBA8809194.1 DNA-binding LacI/PurR family transcriptional regulator [Promicromonospora sukumoe]
MTKAPTVEDVARAAGVSRQTVSNVLNSPDIVRGPTRERVQRAIAELGYRPHAAARRLRTRRSSTIGVRLDPYAGGISGVVLDRFVHALTERASERGMRVLLYAARTPGEEIERIGDLVDGGEIDAVVLTGTSHEDTRTTWLQARNVPFVSFGRPWRADGVAGGDAVDGEPAHAEPAHSEPAHSWADVDGAAGTRAATRHLLAEAGPRIAFLGWPEGSGTGDDRARGWSEAMAGAGSAGPRWHTEESVGLARELTGAALTADPAVDAVVCVSDSLAIGAHLAATALGRPDLPVVGFDNTPAAEALGISSVEQLPEQVAAGVLDLLMGPTGGVVIRRDPAEQPEYVLVEPRLVVRKTHANP